MKFFILLLSISTLLSVDVVHLIPPKISRETIAEMIVCHRPVRKGGVRLDTEKRGGKTIVHCYGHAGQGWSMLFGSVKRAIEEFEKTEPSKKQPIHVIGAGCMGLTAAIELAERGYFVKGISSKEMSFTSSWNAGGLFEMCRDEDISFETLSVFLKIKKGEHLYFSQNGVKVLPIYVDSERADKFGFQRLIEAGYMPPPRPVTLDFGKDVIHEDFIEYEGYFIDAVLLMTDLFKEVERLQIPITQREIKNFDELEEPYIMDCSGLGARELNEDNEMYGATGFYIALNEFAGTEHMNYIVYTRVLQNDQMERVQLFPRDHLYSANYSEGKPIRGVLGGTYHPHGDQIPSDKLEQFYQKNYEAILNRNSLFFHGYRFR